MGIAEVAAIAGTVEVAAIAEVETGRLGLVVEWCVTLSSYVSAYSHTNAALLRRNGAPPMALWNKSGADC